MSKVILKTGYRKTSVSKARIKAVVDAAYANTSLIAIPSTIAKNKNAVPAPVKAKSK